MSRIIHTIGKQGFFCDDRFRDRCPICTLEAKVEEMTRWIPVSERLPETGGAYLVWVPCGRSSYADVVTFWVDSEPPHFTRGGIEPTHWMPLPEPPETGGEKG